MDDGETIAAKGSRAGGVVLLGSAFSVAIQLVSLIVLSRLLSPADFGIVALLSVFVILSNHLRDFGLPTAGLQHEDLTHQQSSNLLWMNLAVAAVTASALAASGPLLAHVMDQPRLPPLVAATAIVVLLGGASAQIQVQLARAMRFRAIVVSDILAQVLGLAVAILFALAGAGPWALIAQSIVVALALLLIRWGAAKFRPAPFRRGHGSRELVRIGANYGSGDLLYFLQTNVDTFAIGAWLGTTQLGYYNRAYQLLTAPAVRLLNPLTQVVVSLCNHARAAGRGPAPILLAVQFAVSAPTVCAFAVSGAVAPVLFPIVLGEGWDPSIPVFQILCIGGAFWALDRINYWSYIVYQRSRELLRVSLFTKSFAVVAILLGTNFGITGVAWAYAISMLVAWPTNLLMLSRGAPAPLSLFMRMGLIVLLAGALSALASSWAIQTTDGLVGIVRILIATAVGTVVMLIPISAFAPSRAFLCRVPAQARALRARKGLSV